MGRLKIGRARTHVDVLAVGEPQLVHAARSWAGAVEKGDRAWVFRHRDVEQLEPGGLQPRLRRLIGDRHDVADRLQRIRAHVRLRQVPAGDQLGRARVADIDAGEIFRRAFVGEPQDAAAVLGDLDRHALADPAKPVELVMGELPKIPDCRIGHVCLLRVVDPETGGRPPDRCRTRAWQRAHFRAAAPSRRDGRPSRLHRTAPTANRRPDAPDCVIAIPLTAAGGDDISCIGHSARCARGLRRAAADRRRIAALVKGA